MRLTAYWQMLVTEGAVIGCNGLGSYFFHGWISWLWSYWGNMPRVYVRMLDRFYYAENTLWRNYVHCEAERLKGKAVWKWGLNHKTMQGKIFTEDTTLGIIVTGLWKTWDKRWGMDGIRLLSCPPAASTFLVGRSEHCEEMFGIPYDRYSVLVCETGG